MEAEGTRVVHISPGRIRLKVAGVKDNPALAGEIRRRLTTTRGVQHVETNPLTGSVLVLYDAAGVPSSDSFLALADSLAALLPGTDVRKLAETWLAQASNGRTPTPSLAHDIAEILGAVNSRVEKATGGLDLKVLLPLSLFFLGVRSVVVSRPLPVPTWYDFLWFALGTFVMLNRDTVDGER
jgi:hypothetical protein